MLDVHTLQPQDLQSLSPAELARAATQMLERIHEQSQQLGEQDKHITEQRKRLDSQAAAILWRDAKIERITFELARLKAVKFGAKTEAMNAEQRSLFEEAFAADQADLETQLAALQVQAGIAAAASAKVLRRSPKRQALPAHLVRVDQLIEPEDTHCPNAECGQPMVRMGEDVSERLDIVPAVLRVQRQIRGKWVCRCCQLLVQEPAAIQVFEGGLPTPALQAHTVVSRFVDHIPYYRQEQINARAGVTTPRSTLSAWAGHTGAQLMPLFDAHKAWVLGAKVLHADETPVALLDPGAGKTKTAYIWAYARGAFDSDPGVVYDFQRGRGGKYPFAFLAQWSGTLLCDAFAGYGLPLSVHGRTAAGCMAHARRKFDELFKANASTVAAQAIQRIAWLYRVEADARALASEQRLQLRQERSKPLCAELHQWLQLERARVPDGSPIAKAIDYSLNQWSALTRFLDDAAVPIDNNHIENLMRPWAMGRKAWLFIGSELAGQRAAIIMSLLQSAKLNGHDPWAYLKDVLTRLPTQLNSRIDELLPHRWKPPG